MNGCSVSDSPAVLGQLLAGIILGPSVFWRNLASGPTSDLFAQFVPKMLNAVSELGVLLLLILTGMETLRARRNATGQRFARRESALAHVAIPRNRVVHFLCQNRRSCPPRGGLSPPQSWPSQPRSWKAPSAGRFSRLPAA
jgi:hypothetical protein